MARACCATVQRRAPACPPRERPSGPQIELGPLTRSSTWRSPPGACSCDRRRRARRPTRWRCCSIPTSGGGTRDPTGSTSTRPGPGAVAAPTGPMAATRPSRCSTRPPGGCSATCRCTRSTASSRMPRSAIGRPVGPSPGRRDRRCRRRVRVGVRRTGPRSHRGPPRGAQRRVVPGGREGRLSVGGHAATGVCVRRRARLTAPARPIV